MLLITFKKHLHKIYCYILLHFPVMQAHLYVVGFIASPDLLTYFSMEITTKIDLSAVFNLIAL